MKILLLDNYDSFTGNICELLRRCGVSDIQVIKNNDPDCLQLPDCHGIVLSPGPATPFESGYLLSFIRLVVPHFHVLGICLGHQAIAQHYGAGLIPLPVPRHGEKAELKKTIYGTGSVLWEGINDHESLGLYHSWTVSDREFPEELHITARSEDDRIMALQHRQLPVYGVQFHPESYLTPCGFRLMNNWLQGINT